MLFIVRICLQEDDQAKVSDAKEVVQGKPYHWKDWCIARGRDCLYIWSDAAALELSNGSNGWFRFILDGKLATMYSSGSPEGGSDSSGELSLQNFKILFKISLQNSIKHLTMVLKHQYVACCSLSEYF